jgi:hypothetical protein
VTNLSASYKEAIRSLTTTIFAARQAYVMMTQRGYIMFHIHSISLTALSSSEYSKNINFYGHLKLCLQPDVSVTTNRNNRRFKCPDVTLMANRAEGLIAYNNLAICFDILDHHQETINAFYITDGAHVYIN